MHPANRFSGVRKILGGCALVLATSGAAHAVTVQVGGTCTLRGAVQSVNNQSAAPGCVLVNQSPPSGCTYPGGSNLIIVPSGTYTLPTSADPANVRNEPIELNRSAWVCGNGVGTTILRGNSPTSSFFLRVVNNDPDWDTSKPVPAVTFERMTVDHTSGFSFMTGIYSYISDVKVLKARVAGFGARALWGDDANVRIEDSTIENNSSFFEGGAIALYNPMGHDRAANLNIQRSTLTNNVSATSGGALYLALFDATNLVNVTISGNRALDGGGIFKEPWSSYLLVWHTTVTNNTATNNGGGIAIFPEDQTLQGLQLTASIVADNSAPTGPDVRGMVTQFRDALIGDDSSITVTDSFPTGIVNVWANLDPVLRDLGGPFHTKVHRPLPGSPAIDAVAVPPTGVPGANVDQRQVSRPQYGASSASVPDMGAVETTRLETDWLTASANATHVAVMGSQYSNGWGTNLQANAVNKYVVYSTAAGLPAGTYNVTIGYKKGSNAGKFQFGRSTTSGGTFTSIGSVQEGYSASNSWVTVNLGNVTFPAGTRYFRFLVTGKHTSSSSYQIFPDFIEVTRQ